ncbi:hypothetical protein J2801_003636 [Paraburkholderia phenoliruptrix]|nr:hypothetical protein [Paraburkholderia phenoliruptrix]
MTDAVYQALRAAVNIARYEQVRCVSTLKRLLIQRGHAPDDANEAIQAWVNYERSKQC